MQQLPTWARFALTLAAIVLLPLTGMSSVHASDDFDLDPTIRFFFQADGNDRDQLLEIIPALGGEILFEEKMSNRLILARIPPEHWGLLRDLERAMDTFWFLLEDSRNCLPYSEKCSDRPVFVSAYPAEGASWEDVDAVAEALGGTVWGGQYEILEASLNAFEASDVVADNVSLECYRCPRPIVTPLFLGPGHRFEAEATWKSKRGSGTAQPREVSEDTGALWFFSPSNYDLFVKVLRGCDLNGYWWVLVSGLTDAKVDLQIRDRIHNRYQSYASPGGEPFEPVFDLEAFPCGE